MRSNILQKEIHKIKKYYSLEAETINIQDSNECAIYWDQINNEYKVEINRNQIDYFLIHEFGHLFFSKITQYPYFIKFTSKLEKVNQEIRLFFYKNPLGDIDDLPNDLSEFRIIHDFSVSILDSFVNYRTFIKKKEYLQLYLNYIKEILNSVKQGFKPGKLRILLPSYINFYLEFNYNVRNIFDKKQDLDSFLSGLKNVIMNSKKFKMTQFSSLHEVLENYKKVKDTNDYKIIINFIKSILLKLSLWTEDTLNKKFTIIFPRI